jgi:16S rRNA (cytidine1402-2'-O)-methyltransferase
VSDASGMLYVVATPIGNLDDLSPRATATLIAADLILAEDTRHSGRLLRRLGAGGAILSLHEHNEDQRISDAGTPLVSDPGFRLVRAIGEAGYGLVPVPGACAAIAALSVAGLPSDRFAFEGFVANRAGARRERLQQLAADARTLIFYESPHRIAAFLQDLCVAFGGERRGFVARELTKLHETSYRGTLDELSALARDDPNFSRGELVIVVAGVTSAPAADQADLDATLAVLLEEMPAKQAARVAARLLGIGRNEAYRRTLELKADKA